MQGAVLLLSLIVTVCASAVPNDIYINPSVTCGKKYQLDGPETEYRLFGTGESPAADCSFAFEADPVTETNCAAAICYMFDLYAHFTNPKTSLSIESGTKVMTYVNSTFNKGPYCNDHSTLKVTMSQEEGYVFDKKKPEEAYKFRLSVYHKCGEKGSVENIKFEDAVDHAKGYHKSGEKEEREKSQFISGILLGFGLACIFLVVLFVAYCYTRNSPNRAPGRSVGMPKVGGFKKKMKPNQQSGPKEVEMGVRYQPQSDRDTERQPEADPLLKKGASDPEKPPVDTAAITVAER